MLKECIQKSRVEIDGREISEVIQNKRNLPSFTHGIEYGSPVVIDRSGNVFRLD